MYLGSSSWPGKPTSSYSNKTRKKFPQFLCHESKSHPQRFFRVLFRRLFCNFRGETRSFFQEARLKHGSFEDSKSCFQYSDKLSTLDVSERRLILRQVRGFGEEDSLIE